MKPLPHSPAHLAVRASAAGRDTVARVVGVVLGAYRKGVLCRAIECPATLGVLERALAGGPRAIALAILETVAQITPLVRRLLARLVTSRLMARCSSLGDGFILLLGLRHDASSRLSRAATRRRDRCAQSWGRAGLQRPSDTGTRAVCNEDMLAAMAFPIRRAAPSAQRKSRPEHDSRGGPRCASS